MSSPVKAIPRRVRRIGLFLLLFVPAAYFAPWPVIAWVIFGVLDVSRHRKLSVQLVEEYFTGKGLLTWALSPINLLSDLLARRQRVERLDDLPDECRAEIEACVAAFLDNRQQIKGVVDPLLANQARVMLAFQWFGQRLSPPVDVPQFDSAYRYVKTISVSTFRGGESTSWHFGPQRLTLRVLRNLEPVHDRGVFIAVDDRVHYWDDEPLLVFDDTMFHQSVNRNPAIRHCLFIDIVRPNRFPAAFMAAIGAMRLLASSFRAIFYRNWSFVRSSPTAGPAAGV